MSICVLLPSSIKALDVGPDNSRGYSQTQAEQVTGVCAAHQDDCTTTRHQLLGQLGQFGNLQNWPEEWGSPIDRWKMETGK